MSTSVEAGRQEITQFSYASANGDTMRIPTVTKEIIVNRAQTNVHWRLYYRFFESSPLHGCSYVAQRRHSREGYAWLAVIALFAALCANDVRELVAKYVEIPTAVNVKIIQNNTMRYENVAICFDVFRTSVAQAIEKNYDEHVFNQSLENLLKLAFITTGNNRRQIAFTSLPVADQEWDVVVKATYLMLVSFSDYDNGVFNTPIDNISIRAIELLTVFYAENMFDIFDLVQGVGKFMYSQMLDENVECPLYYQSSSVTSYCVNVTGENASTVVWLAYSLFQYQDEVCLRLSENAVRLFESNGDWFIFSQFHVSRPSTSPATWNDSKSLLFKASYGPPTLWIDLRGGDAIIDSRYIDSAYWQADGGASYAGVELLSVAKVFNKSSQLCFDYSEALCAKQCIVDKRLASPDKCWPLVGLDVDGRPADAAPCMTHYKGYTSTSVVNSFGACARNCSKRPHCSSENFLYRYSPFSAEMGRVADQMYGTNLTVYQTRFIYCSFEEYPTMDFGALLAAIGGSLGLWIGGSLIAFLHIPIFALDAAYLTLKQYRNVKAAAVASRAS